ncbi:MAG: choline/ethanolamine kinase family protein, partial [Bacilli bacterium]
YNNSNYLINDAFVIRIPRLNGDPTLDFKKEKAVYSIIEPLNLSEKILNFDENDGIKISKFCHNTRKYVETPTDEQILYVAKKLKKLHSAKVSVPFGYMMFHKLDVYKNGVNKDLYVDKSYENRIIREVRKIFAKTPMTLCHNDLVKDNLLFKFSNVILIDWEYAGMNNPYFDLASFVSENNLNEKQEEYFLQKYFGYKYNNIKKKRVDLFISFEDILFYYWALFLEAKRHDEIYNKIAVNKLNRIKLNQTKK